jgi:hypothetical protein
VADPEVFEPENANRVPGAVPSNYGRLKVEVFREEIQRINPRAEVEIYPEGVNADNIAAFLRYATLVCDETELTHMELGTMIARAARERGIPNLMVMNIGFAAQAISFHPSHGMTFEEFMGFSSDLPLEEVAKLTMQLSRCIPYIPRYGDMNTLLAVREGASLPSIVQGVGVASALGATQVFLHIVSGVPNHRSAPTWAPHVAFMDTMPPYRSGVMRLPRLSHYKNMMHLILRTVLGRNPTASYSAADRARRESTVHNGQ